MIPFVTKRSGSAESAGPKRLEMTSALTVSYSVRHVLRHVFDVEETTLAEMADDREVFVVTDEHVWERYGTAIEGYARAHLRVAGFAHVPGREQIKTLDTVSGLCAAAFDSRLPRDGVVIGIGGGVTLDTAGFAAAIYRRGVRYLRVPTSLVGLIDVSVGIKQSVNFHGRKSGLGTFYPPIGSINDVRFIETLPRRHLSCGFAEIIKIAIVCDAELFALLESVGGELFDSHLTSSPAAADEMLFRAESAMMHQLQNNLFEQDRRRLVDFGHTFEGSIEAASDYTLPHGEAVALDMLVSTALAVERGICEAEVLTRLARCCRRFELPLTDPLVSPELLERALFDTRAHRGALNLVVPVAIGSGTFVQDVTIDDVRAAMTLVAALGQFG